MSDEESEELAIARSSKNRSRTARAQRAATARKKEPAAAPEPTTPAKKPAEKPVAKQTPSKGKEKGKAGAVQGDSGGKRRFSRRLAGKAAEAEKQEMQRGRGGKRKTPAGKAKGGRAKRGKT